MTIRTPTERIQALAAAELSTAARIAHTALLVLSLGAAALVASLWLTEPELPPRTHFAFAAVTLAALFWVGAAARTLATRRVPLARDGVTVATLAVSVSGAMALGAAAALVSGAMGAAAYPAFGFALVMLSGSVAALVAARRRVTRLEARRARLERELGATSRLTAADQ